MCAQIQNIVERVCADVAKRAKATDGNEEEKMDGGGAGGGGDKSKSMQEVKLEAARKAKALRRAIAEERMLGAFVRLVDYLCVESLCVVVTKQLRDFLQELLEPERKSGVFVTAVRFNDVGTVFEPTCQEYNSMVDIVVGECTTLPLLLSLLAHRAGV